MYNTFNILKKVDAMKHFLLATVLLFLFTACQDTQEAQAKHDAKVAQEAREALLEELKAKEVEKKDNKYSQMGFSTQEGKIIIDTNKTKHFFNAFANKIKEKMNKIHKDLDEGMMKSSNAGIEIDKKHINIDLNKTKSFLEQWSKKMKVYAKEFNDIAKEFDNNTQ